MIDKDIKQALSIYVVTHSPKCTWLNENCHPLEIGAACRTNHCCTLKDNSSDDNISEKDQLYCELTGLYWIWKNNRNQYVGMYHYRRVFRLTTKKIIKYLLKYDIIAPKKIPIYPSLDNEYNRCKIPLDWTICKNILKKKEPEYFETLKTMLSTKKQYAYNMFVTSSKILDEYCSWLFPLLFEIETELAKYNDKRFEYHTQKLAENDPGYLKGSYDRAIGYLAERLFNIYVTHHNLKVKNVNIYYPKPYNPITTKCPTWIRKIMGKNQFLIRCMIYTQDRFGYILQRLL